MGDHIDVALVKNGVVQNLIVIDADDEAFINLLARDFTVVPVVSNDVHLDPTRPEVRPEPGWLYAPKTAAKWKPPVLPPPAPTVISDAVDALLAADPEFGKLDPAVRQTVGRIIERNFGDRV